MPELVNQFNSPMQAHYAGHQYLIPPNGSVKIRNVRERVADGDMQTLVAEDIAAKLYADLAPLGVILLDEERTEVTDEMREESRNRRAETIRQMIADFNDLNANQASINKPILVVPKHYKALQSELASLGNQDAAPGFTSSEELQAIRDRSEADRNQAIRELVVAQEIGDMNGINAAIAKLKGVVQPGASVPQKSEDDFEVRRAPGSRARGGIRPEASSRKRA